MTDQVLQQLKRLDSVDLEALRGETPPADTFAAITSGLQPAIERSPARRPSRRWLGLAVPALAGTVAIAVALIGPSENGLGPASAAGALHELSIAARASAADDPVLSPGDLYYQETVANYGHREVWMSRQGVVAARGSEFDGLESLQPTSFFASFGGKKISYRRVLDLPRDPERLYGFMRRSTGIEPGDPNAMSQEQGMFFNMAQFLIETPLPADLRAAFYEAAARIDGTVLLGSVKTYTGEPGLGIGMWRSGGPDDPNPPVTVDGVEINQREDLIFDQKTGAIIGSRTMLNGKPDGDAAIVRSGVVAEIGDRP